MRRFVAALYAALVLVLAAPPAGAAPAPTPSAPVIAPGSALRLAGSGFQAYEAVVVEVAYGAAPQVRAGEVTTDGSGEFVTSVTLTGSGPATLTAVGARSGHRVVTAVTVSADGAGVASAASGPQLPVTGGRSRVRFVFALGILAVLAGGALVLGARAVAAPPRARE